MLIHELINGTLKFEKHNNNKIWVQPTYKRFTQLSTKKFKI